jgi:hypothetical protein
MWRIRLEPLPHRMQGHNGDLGPKLRDRSVMIDRPVAEVVSVLWVSGMKPKQKPANKDGWVEGKLPVVKPHLPTHWCP